MGNTCCASPSDSGDVELLRSTGDPAICDAVSPTQGTEAEREKKVRALIAGRADVNQAGKYEWTALHWACINGHAKMATILLDAKNSRLQAQQMKSCAAASSRDSAFAQDGLQSVEVALQL